ncbi:vacuolar protein sorting-associated protein 45 [Reticulomyxa filosa]|uniref:Vacuolar protein sorting-associated protein 45 n=1 Tax=Reticulomyxa filosa TaxID=46433 RepID=X6MSR4_RETFI|nr:vacuolar protein sorting-associated protein 45 [Reticulomyxa filosa]|eukprot:ETO16482.1 vacuolar protein sorting-associated protein 45 [Reticulomyxa filosa]
MLYELVFSNRLEEHKLSRLAQADEYQVVKQVQELFGDIYPINRDLWSLQCEGQFGFYKEERDWLATDVVKWQRQVDALVAFLLAVKKNPLVRYQKMSHLATKMAKEIDVKNINLF